MATFVFSVSTGYVGSTRKDTVEIPDEELQGLSEEEKDNYIYENYFKEWLDDHLDYSWREE